MYQRLLLATLALTMVRSLADQQSPDVGTQKRVRADIGFQRPTRHSLRRAALPSQSSNLPPIIEQFEETSYFFNDIAMINANTAWAVGEPHWDQATAKYKGTIVKTTSGGASWTAQESLSTESFSGVRFLDANQGWVVGTNGTILHTSDGGNTWMRQPVATADDFRGVFFLDANNGWTTSVRPVHYDQFAAGHDFDDWQASIWHTSDGGRTWAQQQTPANTAFLNRIKFVDSQTGWAAGFKLDHYDTYYPSHLGAIYHTSDGGRTWTEQFVTSAGFTFTAMDFVDSANGWAAGFPHMSDWKGGCTFHTSDGGNTWQVQSAGAFFEQVRAIRFVDRNRGYAVGTAYAGDGTAVWRTLDGGATWTTPKMASFPFLRNDGLWGLDLAGDQLLVVGDNDYIVKSTHAWDSCGTQATCGAWCECLYTQFYINKHYIFHDVFFADDSHGWAVGSRTFAPNMWGQTILVTDDGGATWKTQFEQAPTDSLFSYHRLDRVYFTDRQNGWAVGTSQYGADRKPHGGILHTSDAGAHWTEQGANLYASWDIEFSAVQFLNSREGWVLADRNFPHDTVFAAHTTDGGANWSWVDTGLSVDIAVGFFYVQGGMSFTDSQHGCIAGWNGVICTTDGGAHWTNAAVSCGYPKCYLNSNAVAFTDSRNGWIAGSDLYRTKDGGASWQKTDFQVSSRGGLQAVQFIDARNGWVTGDNGVLANTTDGGDHWLAVDSGELGLLRGVSCPNLQHGWIAGDSGIILSYASDRTAAGKPAIYSVLNSASYLPGIASAAWISILGANLSPTTRSWNGADFAGSKLPVQLDGVSVSINGQSAYPSYVSLSQINVLAPADASLGPVSVQVRTPVAASDPFIADKAKYSPALFRFAPEGGQFVMAQGLDGKWIGYFGLMYAMNLDPQHMREAKPGEVLTLYGTGFGPTDPISPTDSVVTSPAPLAASVTFHFGRTTSDVTWAGLIGPGLYQFNIKVPDVPDGANVIVAEIGGYRSQSNSVISVRH